MSQQSKPEPIAPALMKKALKRAAEAIASDIVNAVHSRGGDRGDIAELLGNVNALVVAHMVAGESNAHVKASAMFALVHESAMHAVQRHSTMKMLGGIAPTPMKEI